MHFIAFLFFTIARANLFSSCESVTDIDWKDISLNIGAYQIAANPNNDAVWIISDKSHPNGDLIIAKYDSIK